MKLQGRLLFPARILHALNALQYLRALHILGDCTDDRLITTCEDICNMVGAPKDSLHRTLGQLVRAGIVVSERQGGYYITPESALKHKVIDVIQALGKDFPSHGTHQPSDRLNNAVADCLDVTLDEFFK